MPDFDFGLAWGCVGGARMLVERGSEVVGGEGGEPGVCTEQISVESSE